MKIPEKMKEAIRELPSSVRKKFIKDYKFPVKIVEPNHFLYYLEILSSGYQDYYGPIIDLLGDVERLGGAGNFMSEWNRMVTAPVDWIKFSEGYQDFNNMRLGVDLAGRPIQPSLQIKSQDLYKSYNAGKKFISIDLEQANFNVLFKMCPQVFEGHKDYESWLGSFNASRYFILSKHIRQVIFGNLNPQRFQRVQRLTIMDVAERLSGFFDVDRFISQTADELIVSTTEEDFESDLREVLAVTDLASVPIRVESFNLVRLKETSCYAVEYGDGKFKLKNVPASIFMQAYRYYKGESLQEYDLHFEYEKQLASFMESHFGEE